MQCAHVSSWPDAYSLARPPRYSNPSLQHSNTFLLYSLSCYCRLLIRCWHLQIIQVHPNKRSILLFVSTFLWLTLTPYPRMFKKHRHQRKLNRKGASISHQTAIETLYLFFSQKVTLSGHHERPHCRLDDFRRRSRCTFLCAGMFAHFWMRISGIITSKEIRGPRSITALGMACG